MGHNLLVTMHMGFVCVYLKENEKCIHVHVKAALLNL